MNLWFTPTPIDTKRHHLLISGTGRAGTTFLVQLLGRLGLDIGYDNPAAEIAPHCLAGLERDLGDPTAPYVVKNPRLCDELDSFMNRGDIAIDHILIPMRDLYEAAESRRDVVRRVGANLGDRVIGGTWPGTDPHRQEEALALKFYALMRAISQHDIPHTLLEFPRLAQDANYLFAKLAPVMKRTYRRVSHRRFMREFQALSRPEFIHSFRPPAKG
jgi:hypothetical protein